LLTEAVELPVFHARAILADADLETPTGRDRALDEVVPVLRAMGETITRQELVSEVADRLDTDPGLIGRRLAVAGPNAAAPRQAPPPAADGGDPSPPAPGRRPTVEERREATFLAMCIAKPGPGGEYIARIGEEHLVGEHARSALPWLKDHLDAPLEGLPREDERLFAVISRLVMLAEREPVEESALELSWLMLERGRIDREISRRRREGLDRPELTVELQRERARISDAIATRST
jgi:DNA primase